MQTFQETKINLPIENTKSILSSFTKNCRGFTNKHTKKPTTFLHDL